MLGCGGICTIAANLAKPPYDRLGVYRHQTNTPGNTCGDVFDNGPNPFGDDVSYWHEGEDVVSSCQSQKSTLQLKQPLLPDFKRPSSLDYTAFDGGNHPLPTLSDVAAMGYQGVYTQAALTPLPNGTTTQGGIIIVPTCPECASGPILFSIDTRAQWQITAFDQAEQVVRTTASGQLSQIKQQYVLRVQIDARRYAMSFLIDNQQGVKVQGPVIDGCYIGLGVACPAGANSANVCPVTFTAFTYDVAH